MGLILAFKAFFKAWKEPEKGLKFVEDQLFVKQVEENHASHLRLLYHLQHSSRFIDFLKEDISSFSDAQVGTVVRKIHQDCAQILEELVTIRPLKEEMEGSLIQIPKEYDPIEIKITGKIKGEGPFTGILMHRGWKAHKRSLPKNTSNNQLDIICPAEIEIKA